jgi:hypothetical protein
VSEKTDFSTIERVWLDTTRPEFGGTHTLHVLLQHYRGGRETVSMPVTMPTQTTGPLTLLVSDGATLATLEQRELRPGRPTNWPAVFEQMRNVRRGNRLYVRLINAAAGTVVGGETLPALPASVRSVLGDDKTVASAPVLRTVVGAWDRRMARPIRGSRELTLTLTAR